jgi:hypothetical protein
MNCTKRCLNDFNIHGHLEGLVHVLGGRGVDRAVAEEDEEEARPELWRRRAGLGWIGDGGGAVIGTAVSDRWSSGVGDGSSSRGGLNSVYVCSGEDAVGGGGRRGRAGGHQDRHPQEREDLRPGTDPHRS